MAGGLVIPDDNIFVTARVRDVEKILEAMYYWKNVKSAPWQMKIHPTSINLIARTK